MSIYHTGDNRTGDGEGDDEQIFVDLENVPANIAKIAFTVTIDEAEERGQNFGQVSNAYIRLVNDETGEEILRFDLNEDFSIETAVVFAELYRKDGEWRFNAVGSGFQDGLAGICNYYNLATEG
jgi:tellurium resistance protein TerD